MISARYATLLAASLALTALTAVTPSLALSQEPPTVPKDTAAKPAAAVPDTLPQNSPAGEAVDSGGRLPPSGLILVNSSEVDRLRFHQLRSGVLPGQSLMLRSASTLTTPLQLRTRSFAVRLIPPDLLVVRNTALPFSENNSAMWAGRGTSARTVVGFRLEAPHVRVLFAPQIIASQNDYWQLRGPEYYQPEFPPGYEGRGYAFPYYFYTFPIDQPLRMGPKRIRAFDLGESTVMLTAGIAQVGWSNENDWWGPGIRNAMILSDNAPGFQHLFARTAHPIATRLGAFEMRWLVGSLTESRYFDTVATNNVRSIASMAVTLQTAWDPNLTLGAARSVYATASTRPAALTRWLNVFSNASRPDSRIPRALWYTDSLPGGRDQLLSLFVRYVLPASGAEVYAEWGRTKLPKSVADFLVAPNHTQGYTIGLQWRGDAWNGGDVRVQGEITQLEQSATWRDGPVGSWYTSSRVLQGYTNRGEVIGASIGPGASSQFAAMDYVKPDWQAGVFVGRIRLNEDVHSTYGFPIYVGYCSHDVIVYPGARGSVSGPFGTFSAELSLQNRLDALFQNAGGCPNNGLRLDIRNKSFRFTYTPFGSR